MRSVNTYIGRPIERVEDRRFLRGRGQYIDDIKRDGQWHAAIVRSTTAFGRIVKLDTIAALAMPGVHAIITAADIEKPIPTIPFRRKNPTIAPYAQPVIASEYVRYVGEPVAVVLAELVKSPSRSNHLRRAWTPKHRRPARICCFREPSAILPLPSRRSAATPVPLSPRRLMSDVNASACSGTPRCRWKRAACSRSGTQTKTA
jgi:hypothetical protein